MFVILGIILGVLTGAVNFFIFDKQMKQFLTNKKWHLILLGYLVRYSLIGIVFYFSIKRGMGLFIGAVIGFFITQVVFFAKKAQSMRLLVQNSTNPK